MALAGALVLAACQSKPVSTGDATRKASSNKEPSWSKLSRDASEEYLNVRYAQAFKLITESIRIAEKSKEVSPMTLLALRSKQCQLLYLLNQRNEALAVARACLRQLSNDDWKQKLLAIRFLDVERAFFLDQADYDKALKAELLLDEIDDHLMGADSLETMRRRVRLVEIEFMRKNFDQVIVEAEKIDNYFTSMGLSEDRIEANVLTYLGLARMNVNQVERGRKDLQRACAISEVVGQQPLPTWAKDAIDRLPQAQEAHTLLKIPAW